MAAAWTAVEAIRKAGKNLTRDGLVKVVDQHELHRTTRSCCPGSRSRPARATTSRSSRWSSSAGTRARGRASAGSGGTAPRRAAARQGDRRRAVAARSAPGRVPGRARASSTGRRPRAPRACRRARPARGGGARRARRRRRPRGRRRGSIEPVAAGAARRALARRRRRRRPPCSVHEEDLRLDRGALPAGGEEALGRRQPSGRGPGRSTGNGQPLGSSWRGSRSGAASRGRLDARRERGLEGRGGERPEGDVRHLEPAERLAVDERLGAQQGAALRVDGELDDVRARSEREEHEWPSRPGRRAGTPVGARSRGRATSASPAGSRRSAPTSRRGRAGSRASSRGAPCSRALSLVTAPQSASQETHRSPSRTT